MHRRFSERTGSRAEQRGQKTHAIFPCIGRKVSSSEFRGGCHQIRQANRLVAFRIGGDLGRPPHDERHPMPAFPDVALLAALDRVIRVVAELLDVAGVPLGAVVAGHDEERVLGLAGPLQRIHDEANLGVDLSDEVAVLADFSAAHELLGRDPGPVGRRQREVEEERLPGFLRALFDVSDRVAREVRQHIEEVEPFRRFARSPEHGPVEASRFMHGGRSFARVVLDIDVRSHVERRRDDVRVVEAQRRRSVRDGSGEVDLQPGRFREIRRPLVCRRCVVFGPILRFREGRPVQAQVPLADHCRVVAAGAEEAGHCQAFRFDQGSRVA